MSKNILWVIVLLVAIGVLYFFSMGSTEEAVEVAEVPTEQNAMSFFVTSENPGTGANFGGLVGADQHCQTLAEAVGAGESTWRAYLSASATLEEDVVNARDRIGAGPWYNANGVLIANNLEELHGENMINKETALSEKGTVVNGRGDTPNVHDILTGSDTSGMAIVGEDDTTCSNWTSEGDGSAFVGHHDRIGLDETPPSLSWNSSHGSRGCSLENLNSTGGGGLLYCFAVAE